MSDASWSPADLDQRNPAQIRKELASYDREALAHLITRANREYWDDDAPSLPDTLYDELVEALRKLDPEHPLLAALGPSQPEGPVIEADAAMAIPPAERLGAAVRHLRPMLSLDKCYTDEDLMAWAAKFEGEVLVMPKMDGIACSLRYDADGKLGLAATRGSGKEGEDITVNVLEIEDVPSQLPRDVVDGTLVEIRGEIYMRLSVFNADFAETYSNPRNLTAGVVKNKEPGYARKHRLSFFAYDIDGFEFEDEREKQDMIAALGFPTEHCRFVPRDELPAAYASFAERRPHLDYEIDGVVYRASSTAEQLRLGSTSHHPRWSIAYKFQGDSGVTALNDVLWSVSRTGTITPVAMLEGISLSGAVISRASLHNVGRFEQLGLTEGSTVEVTRRGGVIPNVEVVVEAGDGPAYRVPEQCPACGGPVERRKKREGEFLFCVDPDNCTQAQLGELEHFAKVTKIEGFGPKIVARGFEKGVLRSPADYYRLTLEQLQSFDRLGRKSAQNLVDEIEAKRELELATFLRALGIAHLGAQFAQLLVRNLRTLAAIRSATVEQLIEIKGIQEAIAQSIVTGLQARESLIEDLLSEVKVLEPSVEELAALDAADAARQAAIDAGAGPLAGKSYLFTGTLEAFNRKEAQSYVKDNGGVVAKSVNKDLDVLVVGAGRGQKSSKQKKAEKLQSEGVELEVITEDEFLARIGVEATAADEAST